MLTGGDMIVQVLKLDHNKLADVQGSIWLKMPPLQHLSLCNNSLTELPKSLGCHWQLTRLDVAHNKLTGLPDTLRSLTRLARLDCAFNELEELPSLAWLLHSFEGIGCEQQHVKGMVLL